MSVQPVKTPVNGPLIPLQPNPQTACGTLDDGFVYNTPTTLGGQPPNPMFWASRSEYCNQISWNAQQTIGTNLATIDVLRYCGDDMNDPEIVPDGSALQTRTRAYGRVMWPRWYLIRGATYVSLSVKYDFWLHKPIGPVVAGKLRISYNPGMRKTWETSKLATGDYVDDYTDTLFRENMWEWDVKASDVFSVTLHGNVPTKELPTMLPRRDQPDNVEDPREFYPFFMSTFGSLRISVLNTYSPGSIFSDTVNISIYKSFPLFKAYVLRGHRNDQNLMAI